MVVQHNMPAMTANRYYTANNSSLSKSLEKLSSGYAINRAGDNAAGLAVSEKMRAQIAGLTQASKNAEDGISMVQTYEGALQETDSILQRMRTIAVQSANGSYQNDVDRDALQLEFDQLNDELNQIADTDFNGVVVLNGGVMADGTVANDSTKVAERPNVEEVNSAPSATFTYNSSVNGTVDSSGNGSVSVNGVSIKLTAGAGKVKLGSAASGETVYSTDDVTVSQGKVSGTIEASETYKIDDMTQNITIHGQTYTVGANSLQDADGNDVNFIDGMSVTLTPDKSVNLQGKYTIKDNVVTEDMAFSTSKVSGQLDSDLNGTVAVNDAKIGVKAGDTDSTVTTNKSADGKLTYTVGTTFSKTDGIDANGNPITQISGEVEVSGTYESQEVAKEGYESAVEVTMTDTGVTDTSSNHVYSGDINGTTVYTKDGTNFYSTANGAKDGTAAEKVDFAANDSSADIVNVTADTNFATNHKVSYTVKQNVVTTNDGTKITLSGDKSKIISGGTLDSTDATQNTTTTRDGVTYENSNGTLTASGTFSVTNAALSGGDQVGSFKVSKGVSASDTFNHGTANLTFADNMTLQVGARSKDAVTFNFSYTTNGIGNLKADLNASARGLGTDQVSVKNQEDANAAIDAIDNAINKVSMIRGTFGAIQNRLEHKISNINTNAENLTAAESRIRDTQMDQEMMKFTSAQILSQASQSMLAQANSLPQGVLQLLG